MQGGLVGPTEARGGGGSGGDGRCGGAILEPALNQGRLLFFGRPAKMGAISGACWSRSFWAGSYFFGYEPISEACWRWSYRPSWPLQIDSLC
jgi:hypothetical protein